MNKTALIIGITGQDGSYLAERLVSIGYAVHGMVRHSSMFNRSRIDALRGVKPEEPKLKLHYGELSDMTSFRRLLREIKPDEIYHLAGQSHVGLSFEIPEVTCQDNALATLGIIEALRDSGGPVRFYHASSSEIFGDPSTWPQTEDTPMRPINPYGCAKAFATQLCKVYRKTYGLFLCNGIAFNHESPRRGENFVTRKIAMAVARFAAGNQSVLYLGNLEARRDWGYAPEYVDAMWRALQEPNARDYILATGQSCTVRDFASAAFAAAGLELFFEGRGVEEVARRRDTGALVISVDPHYYRLADSSTLVGDTRFTQQVLGWSAHTVGADVARLMTEAECSFQRNRARPE